MPPGRSMRQHVYCTYFDFGYLPRALALFDSLSQQGDDAPIWVLAMDDETESYLSALGRKDLHVVTPQELERFRPELADVRPTRSRMEFYFTCTPLLMLYAMQQTAQTDAVVIYLDADMYFFDDPGLVLEALGEGSVGIIEHRYPARLARRLRKYGTYNVGWVGIRANEQGRECLDWWAARCLEWCYDTPEDGKYADQGYLDSFPRLFTGVVSLPGGGMDLAPWNTGRHQLSVITDRSGKKRVAVDGADRLVFFHFHGITRVGHWFITSQLIYRSRMSRVLRDDVYVPYLSRLRHFTELVEQSEHSPPPSPAVRGKGLRGRLFRFQRYALDRASIASGNAVRLSEIASGTTAKR